MPGTPTKLKIFVHTSAWSGFLRYLKAVSYFPHDQNGAARSDSNRMNEESVLDRIPASMLFQHRMRVPRVEHQWPDPNQSRGKKKASKADSKKASSLTCELDAGCNLPHFGRFDGERSFARFACGWNPSGLFFDVEVTGKTQPLYCRPGQVLQSDSVLIWIDTRAMSDVHRATRYCHWFAFLPTGGGDDGKSPFGTMLKINRAKEDPATFQMFRPCIDTQLRHDGYRMTWFVSGKCLGGWDQGEHRQIGFNYLIKDNELDNQSLSVSEEFPVYSDPSLWQVLELSRN